MDDIIQIRVSRQMTGFVGLKSALAEAAEQCKGMSDDSIGKILLEKLSGSNYIVRSVAALYEEALLREYKRHIGVHVSEAPSEGLDIKVLGPGCPQCERLEQEVMEVMSEIGIAGDLEHVRDVAEIGRYGVMGSPALVINGKVKTVGSVPLKSKIKAWIEEAVNQMKS